MKEHPVKKSAYVAATLSTALLIPLMVHAEKTRTYSVSIEGNPVGRSDDYTLNTTRPTSLTVQCTFSNMGNVPAQLNIWTNPKQHRKPDSRVSLKPGSPNKPSTLKRNYALKTKNPWWCRLYTPEDPQANDWRYCSYFSISDALIRDHVPFGSNWSKQTRDPQTRYTCTLKPPFPQAAFFSFESTR